MSRWTWIPVLLGCAALVLLLLPEPPSSDPNGGTGAAMDANLEPDLFLQETVIAQFLLSGSLQYELTSDQIRHFEDVGVTRLDAPDLDMKQGESPPWRVRADSGEIRNQPLRSGADEQVVHLRDNVFLEQTRGDRFISLASDELFVYPDRRYAETDRAVMIDTNAGRTKAVGLTADLSRSVLNLKSSETQRVHTIVLPNQFKP